MTRSVPIGEEIDPVGGAANVDPPSTFIAPQFEFSLDRVLQQALQNLAGVFCLEPKQTICETHRRRRAEQTCPFEGAITLGEPGEELVRYLSKLP